MAELLGGALTLSGPEPSAQRVAVGDRSVDLVNLAGAAADPLLSRVRADMGAAVNSVERFWGTDWQRDIVVIATGSDEQFGAQAHLDPTRRWDDIAAVAVADSADPLRREVSGQRIVLAPGASGMSEQSLRIVLAHELFHLAARADTALDAPRWITEGVADFVARQPEPLPPGAAADTALPTDADLDVSGPQRSAGYDRAWWFMRFLADDYGPDAVRRFYREACGPRHGDIPAAVRHALGTDLATLQARWARWLTGLA